MAANDPDAPQKISANNLPDPNIAKLIAAATDVSPDELAPLPYRRPQPNNAFWRGLDFVGLFAAPLGGLITVIVFMIGWIGGPDYAWVSFFYLFSLILFVIFIPAFLRKERRAREAKYEYNRATQARLKTEIAQMLLKQKDGDQE